MASRIVHRLLLRTATPLHIGGPRDPLLDAPVVRNAFGHWYLPGSSVAGVLRGAAARVAGERTAARLFGHTTDDDPRASAVTIGDGELVDFDGRSTLRKPLAGEAIAFPVTLRVVQDHVRLQTDLDEAPGTAADAGKFDREVVPVGVVFAAEIECDGRVGDDQSVLDRIIRSLGDGDLALGGGGAGGHGRLELVRWSRRRFDLDLADDVRAYAGLVPDPAAALPGGSIMEAQGDAGQEGPGIRGRITIGLRSDGPLLIGGEQGPFAGQDQGADLVFHRQPVLDPDRGEVTSRPMIPGTAIRGLIRSRVIRTLLAAGLADREVEAEVAALFGHAAGDTGRRGRLRVEGAVLDDLPGTLVQHVAIDRLTGGSLKSALFTEAPIWSPGLEFDITIRLDGVDARQVALLAHALWDLHGGLAPIGGGTRRGNGRLRIREDDAGPLGLALDVALSRDGEPLEGDAIQELITEVGDLELAGADAA